MRDVITHACDAQHYLVVFDDHTEEPLYLGRAKRLASRGQRIALLANDCAAAPDPAAQRPAPGVKPTTTQAGVAGEAPTNSSDLSLACPADNKLIEKTGWATRKRPDGRTEWLPPPHLDWGHLPACKGDGQTRVNNYHHPHRYLIRDDHDTQREDGNEDDDDGEKP